MPYHVYEPSSSRLSSASLGSLHPTVGNDTGSSFYCTTVDVACMCVCVYVCVSAHVIVYGLCHPCSKNTILRTRIAVVVKAVHFSRDELH